MPVSKCKKKYFWCASKNATRNRQQSTFISRRNRHSAYFQNLTKNKSTNVNFIFNRSKLVAPSNCSAENVRQTSMENSFYFPHYFFLLLSFPNPTNKCLLNCNCYYIVKQSYGLQCSNELTFFALFTCNSTLIVLLLHFFFLNVSLAGVFCPSNFALTLSSP